MQVTRNDVRPLQAQPGGVSWIIRRREWGSEDSLSSRVWLILASVLPLISLGAIGAGICLTHTHLWYVDYLGIVARL